MKKNVSEFGKHQHAGTNTCMRTAKDGHNDWPHLIRGFYDNRIETATFNVQADLVGHVDIGRLVAGRSGAVFLSAYVDW